MSLERPHQFPMPADPDDVFSIVAWRCLACGQWQSDYDRNEEPCPVDWRRHRLLHQIERDTR